MIYRILLAVFIGSLSALPAKSQSNTAQSKAAQTGAQKGAMPGQFDFYVLALSWSPAYCADGGAARSPEQCAPGAGKGFVVHGLWPQFEKGYPLSCPSERKDLPKTALEKAALLYPDAKLASSEWQRHGTCTGLEPQAYLDAVAHARSRITLPSLFVEKKSAADVAPASVAPASLEKAFAESNPGLDPSMIGVSCRKGQLREIRICFTKDLTGFRTCPEIDRSACRAPVITVPQAP